MAKRNGKPMNSGERAEIGKKYWIEGWSKMQLRRRYKRCYKTVDTIIKETREEFSETMGTKKPRSIAANANKIRKANSLLGKSPDYCELKATLSAFCETLQTEMPSLKGFHLNLETGEVSLVLTSTINLKLSDS